MTVAFCVLTQAHDQLKSQPIVAFFISNERSIDGNVDGLLATQFSLGSQTWQNGTQDKWTDFKTFFTHLKKTFFNVIWNPHYKLTPITHCNVTPRS